MISLDTNVIFSALNTEDGNRRAARAALGAAAAADVLVISPPVYTELRASSSWQFIESWLTASQISTLWEMPPPVWTRAGQAFRAYADLRRDRTLPRRIAADFLIAAHAEHHGVSVLTFDETVYEAVFPLVRRIPLP